MNPFRCQFLAPLVALAFPLSEASAHDHLAASVDATGTRLVLLDAENDVMPATNPHSYNVITWDPRGEWDSGRILVLDHPEYEGYNVFDLIYSDDYFSFISLSEDDNALMPPGSQVWMTMELISAPAGGEFAFWETDATVPTYSLPSDGSGGSFSFVLSEWDSGVPDAGQDPGGHIEGRAFTTNLPGDYYIRFNLYDSEGQLDPSEDYIFHFGAVPEPGTLSLGLTALVLLGFRRRK